MKTEVASLSRFFRPAGPSSAWECLGRARSEGFSQIKEFHGTGFSQIKEFLTESFANMCECLCARVTHLFQANKRLRSLPALPLISGWI